MFSLKDSFFSDTSNHESPVSSARPAVPARCYRLFLARAGTAGRALETGDSWLLVSLKNESFKENIDAQAVRD
jgi:hypothetical protein